MEFLYTKGRRNTEGRWFVSVQKVKTSNEFYVRCYGDNLFANMWLMMTVTLKTGLLHYEF